MSPSFSGPVLAQGEKVAGSATVQLTATPTRCSRVWIGAPTASHNKGSANTGNIIVGNQPATADNIKGGIPLDPTNTAGFFYPILDASKVYLTGFNAGDAVEYQIFS